ncbi:MAG TPA: alpha/beta fold hydrolase [Corynebacterium sp.]|nr:alpha/beta fold hydrolase [Corynebacterium sp.]
MRRTAAFLLATALAATPSLPAAQASSLPRVPGLSAEHDVSSRERGSSIGHSTGTGVQLSSGPVVRMSRDSVLAQTLGSTVQLSSDLPVTGPFNDPTCVPTPEFPVPVILIHGTAGGSGHMVTLAEKLVAAGACTWALNYGADQFSMLSASAGRYGYADPFLSVHELGSFVDGVLRRTGASQVDLVGHSQGGTLTKGYVMGLDGAGKVRRVVTLGATLHGTDVNGWNWVGSVVQAVPGSSTFLAGEAAVQQLWHSEFVDWLNGFPDAAPGVTYTALYTASDTIATPNETSMIDPGTSGADVVNVEVESACLHPVSHGGLVTDPVPIGLVVWGLTRAEGDSSPVCGRPESDPDHASGG